MRTCLQVEQEEWWDCEDMIVEAIQPVRHWGWHTAMRIVA